jgi:hypothetical protein
LRGLSEAVLDYESDLGHASQQQRAAKWLGTAGADAEEVARREAELGLAFPPSYRNFLLTSDGWTHVGPFVYELRPLAEVGWFAEKEPELMAGWDGFEWPEMVIARRGLLVSGASDAAFIYLDPHDVGASGEWAAWWYAHWDVEFVRYPSFASLVETQWAAFELMWATDGRLPPPEGLEDEVDAGREAVWVGDTLRGVNLLAGAHERGSVRAGILVELFHAFHGQWSKVGRLGDVLDALDAADGLEAEVVAAELIPLWLRAEGAARQNFVRSTIAKARLRGGVDGVRIADEMQRQYEGGAPPKLEENPEFTAAIEVCRQASRRDADDGWALLLSAMRVWRPTSRYRLAPVALLLDPELKTLLTPDHINELLGRDD